MVNCGNKFLQDMLVPRRLRAALTEIDADGSGEIDKPEWEIAIQAALEKKLAELEAERAAQREADRLADEAFTKEFLAAAMEVFRLLDTDESMSLDHDEFVSDSAWFPSISQLELRGDGVNAMPHRRDAVDVAVRESTRLVREPRQFRDAVVRHRWEASRIIPWSRTF